MQLQDIVRHHKLSAGLNKSIESWLVRHHKNEETTESTLSFVYELKKTTLLGLLIFG